MACFCRSIVGFVLLASTASAEAETTLDEHGGPVKGIAISADGKRALSASFDYSLILWDLAEERALTHLYGHDAAVNAVAFLPGDQAISASDDGTLAIWDLGIGQVVGRLEGHQANVTAVAIAPDGKLAASAGWDRTVRLWNLRERSEIVTLTAPDNVNTVRFSADGTRLFAGGSDGTIQAWRAADHTQVMAARNHDFGVTTLDLADGLGASASIDETVRLWDAEHGEATTTLFGHEGPVLAVALSADGELVASGGVDGTVRVWRRGDGDRLRVYDRHAGPVWAVAFTPDGSTLMSGGADGLVLTYDLGRTLEDPAPSADVAVAADVAMAADVAVAAEAWDDGSRGAQLFRKCAACHTLTPDGDHRAGPTLHRLFGRVAGGHPDYPYSPALERSELVWTDDTISRLFEVGPETLIPGSKMPLQRMPSAADRAALVAYLRRVTASGDDGEP